MDERRFERESGDFPRVRTTPCPNCGGEMRHGSLRTPGLLDARVFVEHEIRDGEVQHLSLDVWICGECGYVELHAIPSYSYAART